MPIEKVAINATLVFLIREGQVILARKEKKIGKGRLNSYGGNIKKKESPRRAAVRELREETSPLGDGKGGVRAKQEDLKKIALCLFRNTNEDGSTFLCRVHVYLLEKWVGELRSTKDMKYPAWYKIDSLPTNRMMPADAIWVPKVLAGEMLSVYAAYGPRQETLIGEVEIGYFIHQVP